MHAICDAQPFLYCDPKIDGAKSSLEFRFAMVPRVAGEKVMVKAGDGSRKRFRSQRTSLSEFDAIFVVFNDHDQFDSDSYAAQCVRDAIAARPRKAPIALIPSSHSQSEYKVPTESMLRAHDFVQASKSCSSR